MIAAPGAGYRIRIFYLFATCLTAAAQAIYVGKSGGTIAECLLCIPASSTTPVVFESNDGWLMPTNTAVTVVPAAAGPAWQFVCEYIIEVG